MPVDPPRRIPSELPGQPPFTRGIHPSGYRGRLWTMRQYAGFGTAEESNRRYRMLIDQGQTGLSVAFDLPTQMGLDPDHPLAAGEVGRVGVSIATMDDFRLLLEGIPVESISISMTINATAPILLAFLVALADERGVPRGTLSGTVQNDILKEYVARGTYIYPPAPSLRLVTDLIEFASRELPRWNPISISGYHIREAGATASQEVAFTLADGLAYVEAARQRGLDLERIGRRISFFFNAHNDFLEEIGKFRAARRLWARLLSERFGVQDPDALRLRFHAQTAGSTLTAAQPDNNITRVALQALAAVLGGTQSLHTNSRDEALSLPSEASARLALRTQQILAYETGVASTVDPLAGAYTIERITDRIEQEASALLAEIDRRGGAVRAVESGFLQCEIERSAYEAQKRIESGEDKVVGINVFADAETRPPKDLLQLDAAGQEEQVRRVVDYRRRGDAAARDRAQRNLVATARSVENLLPPIIAAVRDGLTLGEIGTALVQVFGRHGEP